MLKDVNKAGLQALSKITTDLQEFFSLFLHGSHFS